MRCVIFSNNQKKCQELQDLLQDTGLEVFTYSEVLNREITVIEDGVTFDQNATKKVLAISQLKQDILIADDSGLEVDVLDGRPGVYSARYGGEGLSDSQRCEHVLRQIENVKNRSARFVCSIAIVFPEKPVETVQGIVEGALTGQLQGNAGFGYDPIFIPVGYDRTFAELGTEIKHKISHRSRALAQVKDKINDFLAEN